MEALHGEHTAPQLLSPLNLAFIGDGVYELLVREHLLGLGNRPVGQLHAMTVELVCAKAQSDAYQVLAPMLTEEEEAIYKRGRNAHNTKAPKHSDPAQYRRATGVEALFGFLYLSGRTERIHQLFRAILEAAGERDCD